MDLTRLSSYYDLVKDLMIDHVRIDAPGLARDLANAYMAALREDCEMMPCMVRYAGRVLETYAELKHTIEHMIGEWGAVFIRGDGASPKDACSECILAYDMCVRVGVHPVPDTMYNACVAVKPEAAVALLVASERIHAIGAADVVWLRRPVEFSDEMRVFVYRGKPRLITWYYPDVPPRDESIAVNVAKRYLEELIPEVIERLSNHVADFAIDVGLVRGKPYVVELTPFPPEDNEERLIGGVDTILFRDDFWRMLRKAVKSNTVILRFPKIRGTRIVTRRLQE